MVLGVLGQIAMRPGLGDRGDDPRSFDLLAAKKLGFERRMAAAVIGGLSMGYPSKRGCRKGVLSRRYVK